MGHPVDWVRLVQQSMTHEVFQCFFSLPVMVGACLMILLPSALMSMTLVFSRVRSTESLSLSKLSLMLSSWWLSFFRISFTTMTWPSTERSTNCHQLLVKDLFVNTNIGLLANAFKRCLADEFVVCQKIIQVKCVSVEKSAEVDVFKNKNILHIP